MTGNEVVYVAVSPQGPAEAAVVEQVARISGKDVFGTRVLMNSKIPRVLGHYASMQEAEAVAAGLESLGLVAVVCGQAELRGSSAARFRAHTLKLGEARVAFRDRGGHTREVAAESVFLILRGTARVPVEKEKTTTKTKLNLAATAVAGGVPVMRRVTEKTSEGSLKMEDFVRVYDPNPAESVVEIVQFDFDYSSLEEKKGFSSQENINIIVAQLRATFPAAIFDSRLTAHYKADIPFATPEEETEINSRLIYLCHRAVKDRGP